MATTSMDALTWFRKQLEQADSELLREMIAAFSEALMNAEVESLCAAGCGERTRRRRSGRCARS